MAIANRSSVNSIPTKVQLSPLAEIDLEEDPPTFHFPLIVFLASSFLAFVILQRPHAY